MWRIAETVEGGEFQSKAKEKNGEDCEGRTNRMMDSRADLKKKRAQHTHAAYTYIK